MEVNKTWVLMRELISIKKYLDDEYWEEAEILFSNLLK